MKKTLRILCYLIASYGFVLNSYAQERGFSWGAVGSSDSKGSDFYSMKFESFAGYSFNSHFAAYLKADNSVYIIKGAENITYTSQSLGAMLKYNFYKFNSGLLDLRTSAGTNLYRDNWQFYYWDLGLFVQATKDTTKPTMGIGFRYYDTKDLISKESKSYPTIYISVGFVMN